MKPIIIDQKVMIRLRDIAHSMWLAEPAPDIWKIHLDALRVFLIQNGQEPGFDFPENLLKYKLED